MASWALGSHMWSWSCYPPRHKIDRIAYLPLQGCQHSKSVFLIVKALGLVYKTWFFNLKSAMWFGSWDKELQVLHISRALGAAAIPILPPRPISNTTLQLPPFLLTRQHQGNMKMKNKKAKLSQVATSTGTPVHPSEFSPSKKRLVKSPRQDHNKSWKPGKRPLGIEKASDFSFNDFQTNNLFFFACRCWWSFCCANCWLLSSSCVATKSSVKSSTWCIGVGSENGTTKVILYITNPNNALSEGTSCPQDWNIWIIAFFDPLKMDNLITPEQVKMDKHFGQPLQQADHAPAMAGRHTARIPSFLTLASIKQSLLDLAGTSFQWVALKSGFTACNLLFQCLKCLSCHVCRIS